MKQITSNASETSTEQLPSQTTKPKKKHLIMNRLKLIQHKTPSWTPQRRNELSNLNRESDPDVILINSHSRKSPGNMKIYPYTKYQSNKLNKLNDGVAIAMRWNIKQNY